MKIFHLSDLHIGKRVNEFSMIEDQKYILTKIINAIDDEKPQAIIIAGDVYDKSVPSAEAVELFDDFLARLVKRNLSVLIISGNHDSPERLAFGSKIFDNSGVHISPVFDGEIKTVTLNDEYGQVCFYLFPFVKPANVRSCFPEESIITYNDAVKTIIDKTTINEEIRNILITHQFVTGAQQSDSEEISVGGTDNVDGNLFNKFDYVALGHIHAPQKMLRETMRYSGTPLKYSFSESNHKKSITVIDINQNKNVEIAEIPLIPKLDMREIKGLYNDIISREFYKDMCTEDYLHITLTDEEDILDALAKLRTVYPNIMKLDYDNKRTRSNAQINIATEIENKSPVKLFEEFYQMQNNSEMSDIQKEFMQKLIEKVWEDKI